MRFAIDASGRCPCGQAGRSACRNERYPQVESLRLSIGITAGVALWLCDLVARALVLSSCSRQGSRVRHLARGVLFPPPVVVHWHRSRTARLVAPLVEPGLRSAARWFHPGLSAGPASDARSQSRVPVHGWRSRAVPWPTGDLSGGYRFSAGRWEVVMFLRVECDLAAAWGYSPSAGGDSLRVNTIG